MLAAIEQQQRVLVTCYIELLTFMRRHQQPRLVFSNDLPRPQPQRCSTADNPPDEGSASRPA